ncbi:MAG: LytR C-terminal domain-containing protein [Acidimicrobiales bacterium]
MTDDPQGPAGASGEDNPLAMLAGSGADGPAPSTPKARPAKAKPAAGADAAGAQPKKAKPAKAKPTKASAAGTSTGSGEAPAPAVVAGRGAVPVARPRPAPCLPTHRRRAPVGGEGSPGEASVIGVVMIVFAVLIGAFLLAKGYESEGDLVAGSSPTTVASSSGPPPTGLTTTSTTAPSTTTTPLKAPADVTVRAANGGGEEGVALAGTEKLAAAGYSTLGAVDAPAQTASVVYYAAGFEGEAVEVAKVFDIPETSVEELPAAPPTDPGGADVLVILGPEQKLTN